MTKLIHSKGTFNEWLLPEKLYHGTSDIYLDSILKEGLKINHEDKNSMLSLPLIYLTTSLEMAGVTVACHLPGQSEADRHHHLG